MDSEGKIILEPKYVSEFYCDGIKCGAQCCRGWWIDIDKETYQKYQHIKNPVMRQKILGCIQPSSSVPNALEIRHRENGYCPMVCEDKLCYIQRIMGSSALSLTCQVYPRAVRYIGNMEVRLVSLSCPIAAETALFESDGMVINTDSKNTAAWRLTEAVGKPSRHEIDTLAGADLVLGGLAILQNTAYTREERLIILGLFLDRAEELKNNAAALNKLIEYYTGDEIRKELAPLLVNWSFDKKAHQEILTRVIKVIKENELFTTLGTNKLQQTNINYDAIYSGKHKLLEDNVGKALDKYLQYEWLYRAFPFYLDSGFLHSYFAFLLAYKILELYMYSAIDFSRLLTKDLIVRTVTLIARDLDHRDLLPTMVKDIAALEAEPLKLMEQLLRLK